MSNDEILLFIPVITAGVYFSIFSYYLMYFRTIGIEQSLLNLNLDYYLVNGTVPIAIVLLTFCIGMMGILPHSTFSKSTIKIISFISNSPLFFCGLILIYWSLTSENSGIFSYLATIFFIIVAISFIIGYFVISWMSIPISHIFNNVKTIQKLIIIFSFLAYCIIFSTFFGEYEGNEFISGKSPSSIQISFNFINESSPQVIENFQNETLLLLMHRDGYYYVTYLERNKTKYHPIYLVSDAQVLSTRINQTQE